MICKNCHKDFQGNYCPDCGEKVVEEMDFSTRRILGQAFETLTNFDSKVFRSLKLLLFSPGTLSNRFVEGVRVPYMKPFQIFVISNIIFFIFLSEADLFRSPSRWFFVEYFDGIRVMDYVRAIGASRNLTIEEVAILYDKKSSNLAKGLIVILIPFISLIGKLLNPNKSIKFGKHIVFATHFFSFFLLLCVFISEFLNLFSLGAIRWSFVVPAILLMVVYYTIGTHNFYKTRWQIAILQGILGITCILFLLQFYRMGINYISLHTI